MSTATDVTALANRVRLSFSDDAKYFIGVLSIGDKISSPSNCGRSY
jgi:hypothetical protein